MKINIKILILLLVFTISLDAYACHEDDYVALRALYLSTDGDNWNNNTGWLTAAEFEANPTIPSGISVGTWYGITTNTNGCVICINSGSDSCIPTSTFGSNNLVGSIPPEIENLTNLTEMRLIANQLNSIPSELGNLTNLEWLDLSYNQISVIPPELGNLTNLTWLSLGYNQISTAPPELSNLNSLTYLGLNNNQLSTIHPELGNLANLEWLDMYNNELVGSIPPELGNLTNLTHLQLLNNNLNGSIPVQFGNLNNLINLSLGNNQLSGNIPPELGNLNNLESLYLANNQLSGCYDTALMSLCTQITTSNNGNISNGNNFDATWEGFCATGAGTCTVDIDNTHQSTFTVYPVPARDVVIFDVPNIAAADEIILYDITGRQISCQAFPQDKRLVVSHLNDGVYIYRIFYEDEVYSGKIVVE